MKNLFYINSDGFIGAIISAAAAIGSGIASGVKARKDRKKAEAAEREKEKLTPEGEDYEQRLFFNELKRKALGYETGSASQAQLNELRNIMSSASDAVVESGSGGTTDMLALLKSQANIGNAYNKVLAQNEQMSLAYSQLAQGELANIAQRKLDLQMLQRTEQAANAEMYKRSSEQNKQVAIGSGVNILNQLGDVAAIAQDKFGNSKNDWLFEDLYNRDMYGNQDQIFGRSSRVGTVPYDPSAVSVYGNIFGK